MSYTLAYSSGVLTATKTGGDNDIIQIPLSNAIIHSYGSEAIIIWNYHEGTDVFGSNTLKLNYSNITSPTYVSLAALLVDLTTWQKASTPAGSSSSSTPSTIGLVTNAAVGLAAEQITAVSTTCSKVVITANPSNTGRITVGGVGVTDGNGIVLYAADSIEVNIDNVNKIYVVAEVADEDVSATYFN